MRLEQTKIFITQQICTFEMSAAPSGPMALSVQCSGSAPSSRYLSCNGVKIEQHVLSKSILIGWTVARVQLQWRHHMKYHCTPDLETESRRNVSWSWHTNCENNATMRAKSRTNPHMILTLGFWRHNCNIAIVPTSRSSVQVTTHDCARMYDFHKGPNGVHQLLSGLPQRKRRHWCQEMRHADSHYVLSQSHPIRLKLEHTSASLNDGFKERICFFRALFLTKIFAARQENIVYEFRCNAHTRRRANILHRNKCGEGRKTATKVPALQLDLIQIEKDRTFENSTRIYWEFWLSFTFEAILNAANVTADATVPTAVTKPIVFMISSCDVVSHPKCIDLNELTWRWAFWRACAYGILEKLTMLYSGMKDLGNTVQMLIFCWESNDAM